MVVIVAAAEATVRTLAEMEDAQEEVDQIDLAVVDTVVALQVIAALEEVTPQIAVPTTVATREDKAGASSPVEAETEVTQKLNVEATPLRVHPKEKVAEAEVRDALKVQDLQEVADLTDQAAPVEPPDLVRCPKDEVKEATHKLQEEAEVATSLANPSTTPSKLPMAR